MWHGGLRDICLRSWGLISSYWCESQSIVAIKLTEQIKRSRSLSLLWLCFMVLTWESLPEGLFHQSTNPGDQMLHLACYPASCWVFVSCKEARPLRCLVSVCEAVILDISTKHGWAEAVLNVRKPKLLQAAGVLCPSVAWQNMSLTTTWSWHSVGAPWKD